ncbi:hypothetical protein HDU67_005838, partial [Dinochytrium kinnereticum]
MPSAPSSLASGLNLEERPGEISDKAEDERDKPVEKIAKLPPKKDPMPSSIPVLRAMPSQPVIDAPLIASVSSSQNIMGMDVNLAPVQAPEAIKPSLPSELEQICISRLKGKDLTASLLMEISAEIQKRWIRLGSDHFEDEEMIEGNSFVSLNPADYDVDGRDVAEEAAPNDSTAAGTSANSNQSFQGTSQPQKHVIGSNLWKS